MKHLRPLFLLGAQSLYCMSLCAQNALPAKTMNLLVGAQPRQELLHGNAGSLILPVYGGDYSLSLQSDWLTASKNEQGICLNFTDNRLAGERSAQLTVKAADGNSRTITIVQPGNERVQQATPNTVRVYPTRSVANMTQPGEDLYKSQDGDPSTAYHSPSDQSISAENPAVLTYYFDEPVHLDLVTYVPVDNSGKFGEVDLYFQKKGDTEFKLLGSYDFKMWHQQQNIYLGENGIDDIQGIQFVVKTACSSDFDHFSYATCAEMEFKQLLQPNTTYRKRIEGVTAQNNGVSAENGGEIEHTLDQKRNTLYQTNHEQAISDQNPAILTYRIPSGKTVNTVVYVPRQDGQKNGNFGQVKVEYRTEDSQEFVLLENKDFGQTNTPTEISLPQTEKPIREVRFTVTSANGNFASCAEMEFYETELMADYSQVFADGVMSTLREGVTQQDIDRLTDPLVRELAQDLFDGVYDTKYRVAEYPCLQSPQSLSQEWNTSGKYYDQLQGVTGINISRGKQVVVVEGADPNVPLQLKVVSWYNGEGMHPIQHTFPLANGINTFEYEGEYDGLAYIVYYKEGDPQGTAPVKVHFPYGQVNGYLSPDKTNEEMHQMTANARNTCMDLVGSKVHSVWTAQGLHNYCKASDGQSLGYRQYMNLMDTLVDWEHQLLGFKKYKRVPANKTLVYVNYTYYMFQSNLGVTFKYDQEQRVLNCRTLMRLDSDAIWALSHEWGHQHQMQPYFCWAGLGESSNNMHSCYNVLHMGYQGYQAIRIQGCWDDVYKHLFLGETQEKQETYQYAGKGRGNYIMNGGNYQEVNWGEGDYIYEPQKRGVGAIAEARNRIYDRIEAFQWCPALQDAIREQYKRGYRIPDLSDTEHTVSTHELYVEENTAAFFMLHSYFADRNNPNYVKDFQEDLYESLRQNDLPEGSSIEKTGIDKYELLASAHNSNKEGKYATFKASFPESCWITQGYLPEGGLQWQQNSVPFILNYIRKASRLCGYNLFDYFDRMGFLRTIALAIDDFGIKYYILTEDMKEEFRNDMNELGLKPMSEDMIREIADAPVPIFDIPQIPN